MVHSKRRKTITNNYTMEILGDNGMKKYLQMIGWVNYRGMVDYKEIVVDIITVTVIVIAITYLIK